MTASTFRLIVGLANPGPEYQTTRHNAGAWFLEALAEKENLTLTVQKKMHALTAQYRHADERCHLLIPNTYMNNSGRSVRAFSDYYSIKPNAILIIHDDLDLYPGQIKFKTGGGDGGHNGLADISRALGSKAYHRLRLGIGHPGHRDRVTDYVLGRPSKSDRLNIDEAIERGLASLPQLFSGQMQKALNELHSQNTRLN